MRNHIRTICDILGDRLYTELSSRFEWRDNLIRDIISIRYKCDMMSTKVSDLEKHFISILRSLDEEITKEGIDLYLYKGKEYLEFMERVK